MEYNGSSIGYHQLDAIQWNQYRVVTHGIPPVGCYLVEPVYSGHPWDTTTSHFCVHYYNNQLVVYQG